MAPAGFKNSLSVTKFNLIYGSLIFMHDYYETYVNFFVFCLKLLLERSLLESETLTSRMGLRGDISFGVAVGVTGYLGVYGVFYMVPYVK